MINLRNYSCSWRNMRRSVQICALKASVSFALILFIHLIAGDMISALKSAPWMLVQTRLSK